MLDPIVIPQALPIKKVEGYRMPESHEHLLSWDFVSAEMEPARHYWLNTVTARHEPHVVPVWGIWYQNRIHFEGSMKTAWAHNLVRNPHVAVHLPDGARVVIIEGSARIIQDDELTEREWLDLDTTFQNKYQVPQGSPYWCVEPKKVLAWDGEDLQTMTRWVFR